MSRDEGFAIADISTSTLEDRRVKRLWWNLRDVAAMSAALVVYEAVQLMSWSRGERARAELARPEWMTDAEAAIEALVSVGLLDKSHRIPKRDWNATVGKAIEDRRAERRRTKRLKHQRAAIEAGAILVVAIDSDHCGVCQEPLTNRCYPDPLSTSVGHEPPLAYVAANGWRVIATRPEHLRCNLRKGDRPDWWPR